jgi:VWFA-related protein
VAGLALFGQAQTQPPTFRTGVQLIRIDVSVLDDTRQPVRGLQASDFTVLEDGQPRPIRSFRAVDAAGSIATAASAMPPIPAHEVATNRMGDDTSRLIFILMDRSIPPERPMLVARQIADAAVDAMGPGDVAAILTTGLLVPQNLTSDRGRLHKTIAGSDWSQGLSPALKDTYSVAYMNMGDVLGDTRCMCGLCVMDTIARIANDVRDVPRRKVLLFIGSNLIVQAGPRDASLDVGCDKRVRDSREKLFDALGASGMTVHSIDPNGLATVGPATRATVMNGVERRNGRALNGQLMAERDDFMAAQGNLAVLPDLTGGRTILNNNEPFRLVPDVLHESDAYYLLAFEPSEAVGDVRHTIDVKVARKGVAVHTTRLILPSAPAAAATPAGPAAESSLERALTDVIPNQSVPLGMSVATFAGSDADHAYVGVTLDASAFAAKPGSMPLEIAILASDERGRSAGGARQTGTVQVPLGAAGAAAGVVELQTYLTLKPGEYELRAAVMNGETRAASSVFTHITVPPFANPHLGLSDVVIGTRENAGSLPEGAPAIPIIPTTVREFSAGAPAWAFLRVYRAEASGAEGHVSVDSTVLDSEGRVVKHQSLQDAAFTGRNADVRIGLPLRDLVPGTYVLRIDAKQGRAEASRTITYTVAPSAVTVHPEEHSAELDAALAAAAAYLEQYEHRISAIGAEETYEQAAASPGVPRPPARGMPPTIAPGTSLRRRTRANIMTISLGPRGWVSFRDVFELNGRPVRPDIERLSRILQNVNPDSLEQARQIADESARYNLNPEGAHFDRTINVPMTALYFLRASNQPRSVFSLGKPERVDGVLCTTLQFTEQSRPRLIGTKDDAAAQGKVWIDMTNGGRIVKTELRMQSTYLFEAGGSVHAQTAVTYGPIDKLDLWLPIVMDETYDLPATRQTVTGHATYAGFKEFKVSTSADIK